MNSGYSLFYILYRYIFVPIFIVIMPIILLFNRKLREATKLRISDQKNRPNLVNPLWIHASSGEFEYAKSVIRDIKKRHPTMQVLVTHSSPSYRVSIEKFPGVDHVEISPLETSSAVRSFLNHYKPALLILARGDLWPELLFWAHKRKIKTLLFSYNKKEKPKLIQYLSDYIYKILLQNVTEIFTVSNEDADHIKSLTPQIPVSARGDTRYDQVKYRIDNSANEYSSCFQNISKPILIAGSTWPEDEDILLKAFCHLRPLPSKIVLVPHEPSPSRLKNIEDKLSAYPLKYSRLSNISDISDLDILIVDKVGILSELYLYGSVAFIGGSFKSKVHSAMEALGCGLPVIVGPYYKNNREAIDFNKIDLGNKLNAVSIVKNPIQFRNIMLRLLSGYEEKKMSIKKTIQSEFLKRLNGTKEVIRWIEDNI